ncbi:MAG TPA: peroxide stress protein YaaA [Salinimicrobium sp.]|nr:peroxide stress protein YaaA [Salinimicrobium sp.]
MKIVISPAKSLDFKTPLPTTRGTQPAFLDTTKKVNQKLQKLSKNKISGLMHISDKLADLNYMRYREFEAEHNKKNARPAIFAFSGEVYLGFEAHTFPMEKLDALQDTLRILSGYYGILKPLDLIQAHRLEMGTKLSVARKKDLYDLWRTKITGFLNSEMSENELLVNLASNEYFKSVDTKKLKASVVTPVFKDYKNGKLKVIVFYTKKARGAMARYIVENDINDLDGIKAFDQDGYRYSEELSKANKSELIFTR